MINKKNLLGKTPEQLGDKDAIHTAIVSVRAACLIKPGERCELNEFREAVSAKGRGVGVADPFLKSNIMRGETFWLLLNQTEVPNVKHVWEHPSVDFSPPEREVVLNSLILEASKELKLSYGQLMDTIGLAVDGNPGPYKGELSEEELGEVMENGDILYELWGEWAAEVGYEFENIGSACCPEYEYPEILFE